MPYNFEHLNIIIADDNVFMRRVIRKILQALGFQWNNSFEAANGADVLKLLETTTPDLIISDLNMLPINGLELTRRIRRSEESMIKFVPIIICTGHTETNHIMAARDAGATEVVCKPISARSLYERIQAIIERPREFVVSSDYIGPDRHRRHDPIQGEDRRGSDVEI
jgi:two-component system, chemotaxis family, chemotaxis protein CheY